MKMGNKSYFTYKRAEQEEILKKLKKITNYCGICGKNMVGWGRREKWFSKCYLTFSESSMVTKKTKNKRRRKMKIFTKTKRGENS